MNTLLVDCLECGKKHSNKTFCSKKCSCAYGTKLRSNPDPKGHYVYGHYDEKSKLFYVGKGTGPRLKRHEKRNSDWWEIVTRENGFGYRVFEEGMNREDALELERFICETIGYDNIVNIPPGNKGKKTKLNLNKRKIEL